MTSIAWQEWETRSELRTHLEETQKQVLLVGEGAKYPERFYSCLVASGCRSVEIGVVLTFYGIAPAATLLSREQVLVVGHDCEVTWVGLDALEIRARLNLFGCVFFEFIPLNDDEVLVLHEIGVVRIDSSGHSAWSVGTDIIEGWRFDASGDLILSIWDPKATIGVRLDSGKTFRP